MTQQVPVARMRCRHVVARVGASCWCCLPPPPHSGCKPPTKLCCASPAVIVKPVVVAVAASGDEADFRWWSVASSGLSWLLVSYVWSARVPSLSSSSLAAILNSWWLLLCEFHNLHVLSNSKNKQRRLDGAEVAWLKVLLSDHQWYSLWVNVDWKSTFLKGVG